MANSSKPGLSDNFIAAVAYFTPLMAFFFLAIHRYNKRPYVRFHAWQSFVFNVFAIGFGYIVAQILPFFRFLGARPLVIFVVVMALLAVVIWFWCVISALNGKRFKLPFIGEWADEQAYR